MLRELTQQEVSRFNKLMPDTKCHNFKIDVIWNSISYAKSNYFNTVSHAHSFYEIYCVLEGSIKIEIRNNEIILNKNDGIIVPPNLEHRIVAYSDDFARYDVGFRVLTESPLNNIDSILKNTERCFSMTTEMNALLSYMSKYATMNNMYSSSAIGNALNAFVIDVLTHIYSNNELDRNDKMRLYQTSLAYAAREFIQDNCIHPITPNDVADVLHISARHLARVLKKYYNMSFSTLLETFRVEKAKKYLENTTLSIKEIAYLSGYSNEYTFIRAFARVIGITPGQYKNKIDV